MQTLSQLDAVSVALDWLTATGGIEALSAVRELVARTWRTEAEPDPAPGRNTYHLRERYAHGVEINWTPESAAGTPGVCLVVPGAALSELDDDAQYRLAFSVLRTGLRPTRVDLALDVLWRTPTDLLDRVYDGSRGLETLDDGTRRMDADPRKLQPEMMGFRTMTQADRHKAGRRQGRSIYFGARGKEGGGCQWVLYDKGREQKLAETGVWTRMEARFYKRGELARQVLSRVCESPDGWKQIAMELVLAKVDFREANGRSEKLRRPRCAWWSEFLKAVRYRATESLTPVRKAATLVTTMDWVQRCSIPTLREVVEALKHVGAGIGSVGQFVDSFFEPRGVADPRRAHEIAHQVRVALAGGDPDNPMVALAAAIARGGPPDGYANSH